MRTTLYMLTLSACLALPVAHAASTVEVFSFTPGAGLPDGDPSGLADTRNLVSSITQIEDISVSLNVSGTWNGDIYAYLQHGSGLAVLLNRVGSTPANSFGSSDGGFSITLNDLGGFSDVHAASSGGGPLTGTFGSDGRLIDPGLVDGTEAQTNLLTTFVGEDANGLWTLFVADLSGGDTHTLDSWSMEITGIPEPGTLSLLGLSAFLLARRKRQG